MQTLDVENFGRLITETAECYSQKPITAGAQRRWFEVLRDVPFERVQSAVRVYMRTRQRMPAPADILGIADNLGPKHVDLEQFRPADARPPVSEHGRRCAAVLREFLAQGTQPPSKRWASNIMAAHDLGEPLQFTNPRTGEREPITGEPISAMQLRIAQEVITPRIQRTRERQPGEDDE